MRDYFVKTAHERHFHRFKTQSNNDEERGKKLKCKCERARRHTYPCGSWAELSPQLLPLYPTFSSTFFFLLPPVCLRAQSAVCESPTRRTSPGFCRRKGQQTRVKNVPKCSRLLRGEDMEISSVPRSPLNPSELASCASEALRSSARQHLHRHLPLGATTALLWHTGEAAALRGERGWTGRAAHQEENINER